VDNHLCALAYLSRSNIEEKAAALSSGIEDILVTARRNNHRLGITGALLLSRGWFTQVLEGSAEAVETIFEAIQCDPRHRDVTVLYYKAVEERNFPRWSMAFVGLPDSASEPSPIDGILANPDRIEADPIGQNLVKILTALIQRQENVNVENDL